MGFVLVILVIMAMTVAAISGVEWISTEEDMGRVLSSTAQEVSTIEPTGVQTPSETHTPEPSPINSPVVSPTTKPSPTLSPASTLVIIPTVVTEKATAEQINGYVDRFAGQYAVDPNVLRHIIRCESGFNNLAVNGPYAGLFQFSPGTWATYRGKMGEDQDSNLRFNAEAAAQTGAYVISLGHGYHWPNCIP